MAEMTKWERVRAALRGDEVDRPPAGFWGHDFQREWDPQALAEATVEFTRRYDWDFQKVNPRATYYIEAWGATIERPADGLHQPKVVDFPLKQQSDLAGIEPVSVATGPFAEQVEALRLIAEMYGGDTPFIQTVFNPLSVIGRLAGTNAPLVREWMRDSPADLHGALAGVTETLIAYVKAALETGASGIFYATVDWGTRDAASTEEYAGFGRPYDLQILEAAQPAEFNVLHVCRQNNMLLDLLDYPVHAFNWAETAPSNPAFDVVLGRTDKAVMGGIDHERVHTMSATDIEAQLAEADRLTKGSRYLVGPGCSIPPETPERNLRAITGYLARNARA
jgi:uroporphyrinogen decarboxylase